MKKLLAIFLALLLAISTVACSSQPATKPVEEEAVKPAEEQVATEENTSTEVSNDDKKDNPTGKSIVPKNTPKETKPSEDSTTPDSSTTTAMIDTTTIQGRFAMLSANVTEDNKQKKDITVEDLPPLLTLYGSEESDFEYEYVDLPPIYNVGEDKIFKIKLNLDLDDMFTSTIGLEDHFNVYSDRECTKSIYPTIYFDEPNNTMIIKPPLDSKHTYPTPEERDKKRSWGSLNAYYLVIHHDITATDKTRLINPKRMMFTIGSALDIPTISADFDKGGNLQLSWEPTKDAEEYIVYIGSKFEMKEIGRTNDTHFLLNDPEYAHFQMNSYLSEGYEVTVKAAKGDLKSKHSNRINCDDYINDAPNQLSGLYVGNYNDDNIDSISELPTEVTVSMCAYQVEKIYPVVWDFKNPITDDGLTYYKATVPGTTFTLKFIKYNEKFPIPEEDIVAYEDTLAEDPNSMAKDVDDSIKIQTVPSKDDIEDTTKETDLTETVLDSNTEEPEKLPLELYIAIEMMSVNNTINLDDYPEARGDYLIDVIRKILTQYPLILAEGDIGFDYKKNNLVVAYTDSKDNIYAKQLEIVNKVDEIVNQVTTPSMSILDKEIALHDYLIQNSKYHTEILDAYMAGEDLNQIATEFRDSFTPYGVLINKLGVCQSYAEAFKLLCIAADVPCVVVSGKLDTVPHAWNKVAIDNKWYHVDATNNANMPYAVYNTSDALVRPNFFVEDAYLLDTELKDFISDSSEHDFYVVNDLFANSEEKLIELLNEKFKANKSFFIKINPEANIEDIQNILYNSYKNNGDTSKSPTYGMMFNVLYVTYQD